jgi:putative ABC transport system ATP-binding protein
MTVLTLTAVSKRRGSGARAVQSLSRIDLGLEKGEVVLLEGPSGAGKTTLLAVAAGLLRADDGEVLLSGLSLGAVSPARRREHRQRHVGFVFQRSQLLPRLTVRENVLLAAALGGIGRSLAEQRTDLLLESFGVRQRSAHFPAELSGGEEQRVAVARALVHGPELVLADEPTASLDGKSGAAVAEGLARLARESGVAVLVASHDTRLRIHASRRVLLVDGRIAGS